jgi:hypothetical protein
MMQLVDQAVARWIDIVVPLFVGSVKSKEIAIGIGSAFILNVDKYKFLVTALHVLNIGIKSNLLIANIGGKAVYLEGLQFNFNKELDIAAALITDEWLSRNDLKSIKAASILKSDLGWKRTGLYVAMGYPSSRNELDARYRRLDRYCHSITLGQLKEGGPPTKIPSALLLHYDHKCIVDSHEVQLGTQVGLQGMSGGPCLELLQNVDQNTEQELTFDAIGVLSEWHSTSRAIVASRLSEFFPAKAENLA